MNRSLVAAAVVVVTAAAFLAGIVAAVGLASPRPVVAPEPPPPAPPALVVLIPPAVLVAPASAPQPATITTTTTSPPSPNAAVLAAARSELGRTGVYSTGGFWCAKFASWLLARAGVAVQNSSPSQLSLRLPAASTGTPGDLVWVTFTEGAQQIDHVAVVVTVHPDGSVTSIDGNTGPVVAEVTRPASVIVGFADLDVLPAGAPFDWTPPIDPICVIKPWNCGLPIPSPSRVTVVPIG